MVKSFVWHTAGRPYPGEERSGDGVTCIPLDEIGSWVVAIVDGLGHGNAAADARTMALATIESSAGDPGPGGDVTSTLRSCHFALKQSRGAVMLVASISAHVVTWVGVGNIEGGIWRQGPEGYLNVQPVVCRSGVVGYNLPELAAVTVPINNGDLIVLHTDGIEPGWSRDLGPIARERLADELVHRHARDTDDCCVFVGWFESDNH